MEATGMIRSDVGIEYPDIQYHFVPLVISYDGSSSLREHGFQVHAGPNRSKSRGRVQAVSPDPATPPEIRFNYLSHPDDLVEWRKVCLSFHFLLPHAVSKGLVSILAARATLLKCFDCEKHFSEATLPCQPQM